MPAKRLPLDWPARPNQVSNPNATKDSMAAISAYNAICSCRSTSSSTIGAPSACSSMESPVNQAKSAPAMPSMESKHAARRQKGAPHPIQTIAASAAAARSAMGKWTASGWSSGIWYRKTASIIHAEYKVLLQSAIRQDRNAVRQQVRQDKGNGGGPVRGGGKPCPEASRDRINRPLSTLPGK